MTCIPNRQHRIAIEEIIRGRAAIKEVSLLRQNEGAWKGIAQQKDSVVEVLRNREAQYKSINDTYEVRIQLINQQHDLTKQWAGQLNGKLKKQRRKTLLTAVAGIAATAASVYFLR